MKLHISSLNGLRAISISMVICFQLVQHHFLPDNTIIRSVSMLFDGQMGVNIFFVISGYLITTLLLKEKAGTGTILLNNFYGRRILRILPPYYFLLLVYFILEHFHYFELDSRNWFANLTLTKQFFRDGNWETAHFWFLSVEEVFYLVWPLVIMNMSMYNSNLLWYIIPIFAISRVFRYGYPSPHFNNSILNCGDALLVGCMFAIHSDKIASWIEKKRKWTWIVFPVLIISQLIYIVLLDLNPDTFNTPVQMFSLHNIQACAYALFGSIGLVSNLTIGLIVIISIHQNNTLWFRFLNTRLMELIGRLSYGLYLWQQLFTGDRPYLHNMPVILLVAIIFVCACFSYYLIERPFSRLKSKFGLIEKFTTPIKVLAK